jgi:hypothetical protein
MNPKTTIIFSTLTAAVALLFASYPILGSQQATHTLQAMGATLTIPAMATTTTIPPTGATPPTTTIITIITPTKTADQAGPELLHSSQREFA